MSTPLVEATVKFLNSNLRETAESDENDRVTRHVAKHEGDYDVYHAGRGENHEHVLGGTQPARDAHVYHVHNTKTGKTHSFAIEGSRKHPASKDDIRASAPKEVSNKAIDQIHKDHREAVGAND